MLDNETNMYVICINPKKLFYYEILVYRRNAPNQKTSAWHNASF